MIWNFKLFAYPNTETSGAGQRGSDNRGWTVAATSVVTGCRSQLSSVDFIECMWTVICTPNLLGGKEMSDEENGLAHLIPHDSMRPTSAELISLSGLMYLYLMAWYLLAWYPWPNIFAWYLLAWYPWSDMFVPHGLILAGLVPGVLLSTHPDWCTCCVLAGL